MESLLGTVKLEVVERAINQLKKKYGEQADSLEISYEFLVASFFPDAYQKMLDKLKEQYTQGYLDAYKEVNAKSEGVNNENIGSN